MSKKEKRLSVNSVLNRLNEEDETQYELENELLKASLANQQKEAAEQEETRAHKVDRLFPILPFCNLSLIIDAKRRRENLEQLLIDKFIYSESDFSHVSQQSLDSKVRGGSSGGGGDYDEVAFLNLNNLCLNDECLKDFKYTNLIYINAPADATDEMTTPVADTIATDSIEPKSDESETQKEESAEEALCSESEIERLEAFIRRNNLSQDYNKLIENARRVRVVNLSKNSLRSIPISLIENFVNVQSIDLSENNLEMFELITLLKFDKLKEVNLSNNIVRFFKAVIRDPLDTMETSRTNLTPRNENDMTIGHDSDASFYSQFNANLFNSIERLNLANNRLKCVNCLIISQFRNLKYLNLSNNEFQITPTADINAKASVAGRQQQQQQQSSADNYQFPWQKPNSQLKNLIELNLSKNNKLFKSILKSNQQQNEYRNSVHSVVPHSAPHHRRLSRTPSSVHNLAHTAFSGFKTFHNLNNLRILNLSENNLHNLPNDLKDLKYLEQLYLDQNNLEFIPSELNELRFLKVLSMADNKLTEISEQFCSYSRFKLSIEKLNLSKNRLKNQTLTNRLVLFENLKQLNLAENEFELIPSGLPIFLEVLNLNKNSIKTLMIRPLPPEAWQDEEVMTALKLNTNKVYEDSLYGASEKEKANESIDELPDVDQHEELTLPHVFYLRNLKRLDLADNYLVDVPNDFGVLNSSLELIDLSNNLLAHIGTGLCRGLGSLKFLNLSSNKIQDLPDKLRELSDLEVLNLSNNKLAYLNYELCNDLKNLRELNLSSNMIDTLPLFSSSSRRSRSVSQSAKNKHRMSISLVNPDSIMAQKSRENSALAPSSATKRNSKYTFNLASLCKIDLSSNRLNGTLSLYTAFSQSNNLEIINVSSNRIAHINVESLDEAALLDELSNAKGEQLPNDNHMRVLKSSAYKLSKLRSFNLSNNQMNFKEGGLAKLLCDLYRVAPSLKAFLYDQLNGLKLGQPPIEPTTATNLPQIKSLDHKLLGNKNPNKKDEVKKGVAELQAEAIAENKFDDNYYFNLSGLESKVDESKVANPFYDALLDKLEVLDLSNNGLKKIPDIIYKLKSLKEFYFNGNQLKKFPIDMYDKREEPKLAELTTNPVSPAKAAANENNELDEEELDARPKKKSKKKLAAELKEKQEAEAEAKRLAEEAAQPPPQPRPIFDSLEVIELNSNQIESVPDNLFQSYKSLREIKLVNNPLKDPPQESVCISAKISLLERKISDNKLKLRNQSRPPAKTEANMVTTTTTLTLIDTAAKAAMAPSSSSVVERELVDSRTENELNLPNLFYEANDNVKALQSYMLKFKKREDLLLCNMFLIIKDNIDSLETLLKLLRRLRMPMDKVQLACKEIADNIKKNWTKIAAKEFAPEPGKMSLTRKELSKKMNEYILKSQTWNLLNYWRNTYTVDAQSDELMRILRLMNSNQYENDLYEKLLTLKCNSNLLRI